MPIKFDIDNLFWIFLNPKRVNIPLLIYARHEMISVYIRKSGINNLSEVLIKGLNIFFIEMSQCFRKEIAHINVRGSNGLTPLMMAIKHNRPDCIYSLYRNFSYQLDCNTTDEYNQTPLLYAIKLGRFSCITALYR